MNTLVSLLFLSVLASTSAKKNITRDNSFDIYIFTLHWPFTTCLDWMESGKGHQCSNIDKPSWSVHGLWPTRYGQIAPNFCNNSWHYNHEAMLPIMDDLRTYWQDVELRGVNDSLWSHEWKKHGTCATLDTNNTTMSSQTEYFRTGCKLAAENPVTEWLSTNNVSPDDTKKYTTDQVWKAVLSATGHRPHIDCIKIDGEAYITEVKVCYDKALKRVDCDRIVSFKTADNMMGTCLRYDSFWYPGASVPHYSDSSSSLGMIVGVILGVIGLGGVAAGGAYFIGQKYTRRARGYESL